MSMTLWPQGLITRCCLDLNCLFCFSDRTHSEHMAARGRVHRRSHLTRPPCSHRHPLQTSCTVQLYFSLYDLLYICYHDISRFVIAFLFSHQQKQRRLRHQFCRCKKYAFFSITFKQMSTFLWITKNI